MNVFLQNELYVAIVFTHLHVTISLNLATKIEHQVSILDADGIASQLVNSLWPSDAI